MVLLQIRSAWLWENCEIISWVWHVKFSSVEKPSSGVLKMSWILKMAGFGFQVAARLRTRGGGGGVAVLWVGSSASSSANRVCIPVWTFTLIREIGSVIPFQKWWEKYPCLSVRSVSSSSHLQWQYCYTCTLIVSKVFASERWCSVKYSWLIFSATKGWKHPKLEFRQLEEYGNSTCSGAWGAVFDLFFGGNKQDISSFL